MNYICSDNLWIVNANNTINGLLKCHIFTGSIMVSDATAFSETLIFF